MADLPIGTYVECEYWKGSTFRGWINSKKDRWNRYLIKVELGTGHKNEDSLHSGNGISKSKDSWYCFSNTIRLASIQYDPLQNGDTDEDI